MTAQAASLVQWAMTIGDLPPLEDLSRRDRQERVAWLEAVFGPLTRAQYAVAETALRTAVACILSVDRTYTVSLNGQHLTASLSPKTRSLCVSVRRGRPRKHPARPLTLAQQLMALLRAARGQVARCRECSAWFSRETAKQRFCGPRCANSGRSRRYRARNGAHTRAKMIWAKPGKALGWDSWKIPPVKQHPAGDSDRPPDRSPRRSRPWYSLRASKKQWAARVRDDLEEMEAGAATT